jgi:hypothetical protein
VHCKYATLSLIFSEKIALNFSCSFFQISQRERQFFCKESQRLKESLIESKAPIEILVKDEFFEEDVLILDLPSNKPAIVINQPSLSKTHRRSANGLLPGKLQHKASTIVKLESSVKDPERNISKRQPLTLNPTSSNLGNNKQQKELVNNKASIQTLTERSSTDDHKNRQSSQNTKMEVNHCCILCEKIASSTYKVPIKCNGGCENWFHLECLKIEYSDTIITWKCFNCTKGKLFSMFIN